MVKKWRLMSDDEHTFMRSTLTLMWPDCEESVANSLTYSFHCIIWTLSIILSAESICLHFSERSIQDDLHILFAVFQGQKEVCCANMNLLPLFHIKSENHMWITWTLWPKLVPGSCFTSSISCQIALTLGDTDCTAAICADSFISVMILPLFLLLGGQGHLAQGQGIVGDHIYQMDASNRVTFAVVNSFKLKLSILFMLFHTNPYFRHRRW